MNQYIPPKRNIAYRRFLNSLRYQDIPETIRQFIRSVGSVYHSEADILVSSE